jgi:hypothetical protein
VFVVNVILFTIGLTDRRFAQKHLVINLENTMEVEVREEATKAKPPERTRDL